MSGHLIGCAGTLTDERLAPSHKLALLAFADSADDRTHIAFPGYEGVQQWAGCSRGRAAELIRDLVGYGYLLQHKKAHRGQRAEYVVFPGGCCDLHRAPAEEPPVDVDQLARAAGVSVDQARALLEAMSTGTPAQDALAADPQANGSDASDTPPVNESGTSDPFQADIPTNTPDPVDNPRMGPERVQRSRSNANAFTPPTTTPLTPASGGAGCARHPDGPGPNCRGCGTTNRQLAAALKRDRVAADAAARLEAQLRRAAAADAQRPDPTVTAARRDQLRRAMHGTDAATSSVDTQRQEAHA